MFNLKPKQEFQIGDDAWFIYDGKTVCKKITGVYLSSEMNKYCYITSSEDYPQSFDWSNRNYFHTKEELLASL